MGNAVDDWLRDLSPEARPAVDRLREIVRAAAPDLDESIKWNAPSFADRGHDRVTLGVERRGGYRLVLHRGATAQTPTGFQFDDPSGLARWPSPDRGVATFAGWDDIDAQADALTDLIVRWVAITRED